MQGNTTKVIDEKQAVPGNNIYLTIVEIKSTEDSLKHALEEIQSGTFKAIGRL